VAWFKLRQTGALLLTDNVTRTWGVELSAEASPAVTDSRPASRPQDIRVGRHARDPRGSVEAGPYTTMAAALKAYDRHLGLTTARRRS
jgi:hypothetical protein